LDIEKLYQHTAGLLVGVTEPCLADWAGGRRVRGKGSKTITTPHAPNKAWTDAFWLPFR
jgi:tartrate dehydratase alpha subunit/fumarate hydratase class I-like protein